MRQAAGEAAPERRRSPRGAIAAGPAGDERRSHRGALEGGRRVVGLPQGADEQPHGVACGDGSERVERGDAQGLDALGQERREGVDGVGRAHPAHRHHGLSPHVVGGVAQGEHQGGRGARVAELAEGARDGGAHLG